MEQEYPFRPRGKHGFDREDVINYISQAQQRCNEHLARMEELEAAKNAWYTQAKSMEREKAALVARNQELEEQLEQGTLAVNTPMSNGDWFAGDPLLSSFTPAQEQEMTALRARSLELEQSVERQMAQSLALEQELERQKGYIKELEQQLFDERGAVQTLRGNIGALEQEVERRTAERVDVLPQFNVQQQEADALRAQLNDQVAVAQGYAVQVAALEQEKMALSEKLVMLEQEKASLVEPLKSIKAEKDALETALEGIKAEKVALSEKYAALEQEKATFQEQLPTLQGQLKRLAETAEQITTLEAVKTGLTSELDAARKRLEAGTQAAQEKTVALAALQQERDTLAQKVTQLAQELEEAQQHSTATVEEIAQLRRKIGVLEANSAEKNEETLRSMVLASFNYSNLYVDNNLKTAQFISEATSRNIGHVSDSANTLLEQLESIGRSFNDTTDNIRRNIASFQRELSTIQAGMNRRLSQDRFKALLEENERLRSRLENELLAELNSEEDTALLPQPEDVQPQPLPFAEDLPQSYHAYLDS